MKKSAIIVCITLALATLTGCTSLELKTVTKTVDPYFHGENIDGTRFVKVTDKVYTFCWNWYRNLVVVTND